MRKGCTLISNKSWSKYSQWWSFSESKPVPCTNNFRKKWLSILAKCMTNLSKFHVVFSSSSTLIHLDKDAFEGHLCQTVNNLLKQNGSILLSPFLEKEASTVHPNTSSISIPRYFTFCITLNIMYASNKMLQINLIHTSTHVFSMIPFILHNSTIII